MQAFTFWKTVTMDQANLLEHLVALFDEHGILSLRAQVPQDIRARLFGDSMDD